MLNVIDNYLNIIEITIESFETHLPLYHLLHLCSSDRGAASVCLCPHLSHPADTVITNHHQQPTPHSLHCTCLSSLLCRLLFSMSEGEGSVQSPNNEHKLYCTKLGLLTHFTSPLVRCSSVHAGRKQTPSICPVRKVTKIISFTS